MNQAQRETLNKMGALVAGIAGAPVDVTIRSNREFTFTLEGLDMGPAEKLARYFKAAKARSVEAVADAECECVFVYLDA